MKVDMSPEAVTRRLRQVSELRRLCLSLADTSLGRRIQQKNPDDPVVKRTREALGKTHYDNS